MYGVFLFRNKDGFLTMGEIKLVNKNATKSEIKVRDFVLKKSKKKSPSICVDRRQSRSTTLTRMANSTLQSITRLVEKPKNSCSFFSDSYYR